MRAAKNANRDLIAESRRAADVVFYDTRTLRGEVAQSLLEIYLPDNFFSLEPQRIAEFRNQFAEQRLKYQKEVQSVVREFTEVASEGQLENLRGRIIDIASQRIEETKRYINERSLI